MPRLLDHVLREGHGVVRAADVDQVADQPLGVVRVVVNLIRQHAVVHHVRMIDAGRRLLLPGGVRIALQIRIDVARHVPHVGDLRRRLATQRGRLQRPLGLLAIPEVDAVMMGRVQRLVGEDLGQHRVHRLMAVDRQTVAAVQPDLQSQKGLGFELVGILVDQPLQVADQLTAAILLVLLRAVVDSSTDRRSTAPRAGWRVGLNCTAFSMNFLARLSLLILAIAMPQ